MANVDNVDTREFNIRVAKLDDNVKGMLLRAVTAVGDEVMRLSQQQVPHDTGLLQNSGHVEKYAEDEAIVGYNKVYAARLHEHPEYRFQGGRKGKYLEDPIKNNLTVFKDYFTEVMSGAFR